MKKLILFGFLLFSISTVVSQCGPECDYCWIGTSYENNCEPLWMYDTECDCGCQFTDIACPSVTTSTTIIPVTTSTIMQTTTLPATTTVPITTTTIKEIPAPEFPSMLIGLMAMTGVLTIVIVTIRK